MKRFVEGEDRTQSTLFPERLDEYIAEDNPVRVIDVFVEELDLASLGFERVQPQAYLATQKWHTRVSGFFTKYRHAINQVRHI